MQRWRGVHYRPFAGGGWRRYCVLKSDVQIHEYTRSLWERACSRRGSVSRHQCGLANRFREQARSHFFGVPLKGQAMCIK
ncbi:hypothetical protein EMIT0P43_20280 [Pseudomonas jessenii]